VPSASSVYAPVRAYTVLQAGRGYLPSLGDVIQREGPVAPWRQIAAIYRAQIESGELAPGDRLPSIASLAQEYEVARTTAQKVIESLRDDDLVVTSPMGTYVK
jgi:GntR family transcriptional regulator